MIGVGCGPNFPVGVFFMTSYLSGLISFSMLFPYVVYGLSVDYLWDDPNSLPFKFRDTYIGGCTACTIYLLSSLSMSELTGVVN